MTKETVLVYHGSTEKRVSPVIDGGQDLIGIDNLKKPSLCGSITQSEQVASTHFAQLHARRESDAPVVLKFELNPEILINNGPMAQMPGVDSFSTTLTVDPADPDALPDTYLETIKMTRETAIERAALGINRFFRVPHESLTAVTEVTEVPNFQQALAAINKGII
jgi:hypothetical protein